MEFRRVLFRSADNLLEQLSVVEQVELAAQLRGADPTGAVALLEAVGLADRAGSALPQLSGGEQDRKSVVEGKNVSVRVDLGGRRLIQKQHNGLYSTPYNVRSSYSN